MLSSQTVLPAVMPTFRLDPASNASGSTSPNGTSAPSANALTPTQILTAYGYNQVSFAGGIQGTGAGQTIAIIDAYDDPTIAADVATFSSFYNLPQFGSQGGPTLTVTGANGVRPTQTPPSGDDWTLEISLDVEWAHALAPEANILLVEATSDTNIQHLLNCLTFATSQSNVSVVSMSWGNKESTVTDTQFDSDFLTPSGHQGITFLASTGDTGSPGEYPAFSPNVVAVGGTSLTLNGSGGYGSETVWETSTSESTGGGTSTQEPQPTYQEAVVPSSDSNGGENRAEPDVAFDADPNTGVAIVDSFDNGTTDPWFDGTIGGTSFGTPAWAALIAIADQGRVADGLGTLNGLTQTLPALYTMPSTNFHDITTGTNGTFSATVGYDLVTGRGTPMAAPIVSYLDGFSVTATSPVAGSTVHQLSPTSFQVTFSDAYSTTGLMASDFEVNGVTASSFTDTNPTTITFTFTSSPVNSGLQAQTMTIVSGTIDRANDGAPIQGYSQTFNYDPTDQLAVSSTSPTAGAIVTVPFASLTIVFNEAYSASSISTSNLQLSEGTVTGFTLVNGTTVMYSLSGLTNAGTMSVSIASGAIKDTGGGGIAPFSESFTLVTGLLQGTPIGSLVYEAEFGGVISTGGGSESYTLNIAAGEVFSATVDPTTSSGTHALSSPQLVVTGPGISGSDSASGNSTSNPTLQTITSTGGTYTFVVSSSSQFRTGAFDLEIFLNSAVSISAVSETGNNTLAKAQNIGTSTFTSTGSFTAIGPTATRGAVIGLTDALSNNATDYYSFTLAAGQTVSLGVENSGNTSGTVNVSLLNSSGTTLASGSSRTDVTGGIENFTASTSGTYVAAVTGSVADIVYILVVTRSADFDFKGNSTQATAQNISGTAGVLGAITSSSPDWYAVNLTAGSALNLQTSTFGSPNNSLQFVDSVQPQISVFNSSGTLLASGTGSPNQSLTADAGSTGTYYIEVSGASGSTGEYFVNTQIDPTAPAVTGVYVGSTAWTSAFMNYLASDGIGSSTLGYLVPAGSNQLAALPWVNINTISVAFNENVSINTADSALELIGSSDLPAPASFANATFSYSSTTHTATWTFASPLVTDKFLINIPAADVTDSLGTQLAGQWTNGASSYPSGNGTIPGTFDFQFNVLHADVNQDGGVSGADGNAVRLKLLQNVTTSGYSPFYDVAGTGSITGADGSYVRINLTDTLPLDNPSPPGGVSGGASSSSDIATAGSSTVGSSTVMAGGQVSFGSLVFEPFAASLQPSQSAGSAAGQSIGSADGKNLLNSKLANLAAAMFDPAINDALLPAMSGATAASSPPNALESLTVPAVFASDFAPLATVPSAALADSAGGGMIDGGSERTMSMNLDIAASDASRNENSRANSTAAEQDSLTDIVLEQNLDWLLE